MKTGPQRNFLNAVSGGAVEGVIAALEAGIDVNTMNEFGDTALIIAVTHNRSAVVRKLIDAYADRKVRCVFWQYTPLVLAASMGHASVVEVLKQGADKEERKTALDMALQWGFDSVVQILQTTPSEDLLEAAENRNVDGVIAALEKEADVNTRNEVGANALLLAARNGHNDIVKILIEAGSDRVGRYDLPRMTPLVVAAFMDRRSIVEMLMVDASKEERKEALKEATHPSIINMLKNSIDEEDAQDVKDIMPMIPSLSISQDIFGRPMYTDGFCHHELARNNSSFYNKPEENSEPSIKLIDAAQKGNAQGVIAALEAGADINAMKDLDFTALHEAAVYGRDSVVNVLLENKADIEFKGILGSTALILAAREGHSLIVERLLRAGADKDAQDAADHTALIAAAEAGHDSIVQILVNAGVNKEATKRGETALHIVCQLYDDKMSRKMKKVIEILILAGAHYEQRFSSTIHGQEAVKDILFCNIKKLKPVEGISSMVYERTSLPNELTSIIAQYAVPDSKDGSTALLQSFQRYRNIVPAKNHKKRKYNESEVESQRPLFVRHVS